MNKCSYEHVFERLIMKSDTIPICSCLELHADALDAARKAEMPVTELLPLADLFKVFADATRLRILNALSASELCVCDLAAALEMTQSAISHQLAILRRTRLVRPRRDGKVIFYTLDDEHVRDILHVAGSHLIEQKGK